MIIMRNGIKIRKAVLHCAAVPDAWTASRSLADAVQEVTSWHKARGFRTIGYHYVIHPTGDFLNGRSLSSDGAHVAGHNHDSIGILLLESRAIDRIGNFADYFTSHQRASILRIMREHEITQLTGHNEYANKLCPGFDVGAEFPTYRPFPPESGGRL